MRRRDLNRQLGCRGCFGRTAGSAAETSYLEERHSRAVGPFAWKGMRCCAGAWNRAGQSGADDPQLTSSQPAALCARVPQIGVVGRTGSGKTTLLMALFRLLDLAGGRVLVDGADIAALPLKEVRMRVTQAL